MEESLLRDLNIYDLHLDELDDPAQIGRIPEHQLISSILLRAICDLLDKEHCGKALAWFFFTGPAYDTGYTFLQCCDYLDYDLNEFLIRVCELEDWVHSERMKGNYKKILTNLEQNPHKASTIMVWDLISGKK